MIICCITGGVGAPGGTGPQGSVGLPGGLGAVGATGQQGFAGGPGEQLLFAIDDVL